MTRSEHDERVWQAKTFAELRAVTHDLVTSPHQSYTAVERPTAVTPATKLTCIFSENQHGFHERLSEDTSITAVFDEFDLDLRDVDFAPGEYRIHVQAAMSEITLRFPPGVRVHNRLTTILSEDDLNWTSLVL